MSLAEIQSTLAGAPGSQVTVLIVRIGKPDPLKLTITRAAEAVPSSNDKMMEDGIGYVRPETLTKGKGAVVPPNTTLQATNTGEGQAKILAYFVTLESAPFSTNVDTPP